MATHSSVLAWRIPGTEESGGLPSMGSHRVGHDRNALAAAAAAAERSTKTRVLTFTEAFMNFWATGNDNSCVEKNQSLCSWACNDWGHIYGGQGTLNHL